MSLLPALFGAGAGAGIAVVVLAWRVERMPAQVAAPANWPRAGTALGCGLLVHMLTGWPVLGLLTAVGTIALPRVMSGARRRAVTERGEAVARWVEMLRDTMAGAAGLEEAVAVTAQHPPPPIRTAVEHLARRLQHQPLPSAMRGFAAEAGDPSADLLAAALITASTNEARDLGRLLGALVDTTRAQVHMRRSIDAGRAHVRSATRLVLMVTLAFIVALFAFSRDYLAPYATVEGQLWLGLVGLAFFAALALLVRLDRSDLPERRLVLDTADTAAVRP
jgi:Flp pilus assembly protein TadB